MKNLYLPNIGSNYYIDISRELIKYNFKIKLVGFGEDRIYQPKSLKKFINEINPKVLTWEDTGIIERFNHIFDPDYSIISSDFFSKISYFEKVFLMALDRNLFDPISQIERIRIFHKLVAHAYKLLKKEKIDGIVFFGTPHGAWALTICAVAEILKIKIRYTDFGLFPELSTIETDINIRKNYSKNEYLLGNLINPNESKQINKIIKERVNSPFVWARKAPNKMQKNLKVIKRIIVLFFFKPFSKYYSSEFFFNSISRRGFKYIFKYFKYLRESRKSQNFYQKYAVSTIPKTNSIVIFFHMQPEASTLPMGYIFSDQQLMLEIILASAPKDLTIYIKEHPHIYTSPAEDRHERSEYFYREILRDKRVKFLDMNLNTNLIIKNAKFICSTCGSVSWEALKLGKSCIVFGRAWFSDCKSCYSVDSSESFLKAINQIKKATKNKVKKDVKEYLEMLEKRLIYGAANTVGLKQLNKKNYRYSDGVHNIAKAIKESFKKDYKINK